MSGKLLAQDEGHGNCSLIVNCYFLKNICFYLLIWLCWVLILMCGLLSSCGTWA